MSEETGISNLEKLEILAEMFKETNLSVQDMSRTLSYHDGDLNSSIMSILQSRPAPRVNADIPIIDHNKKNIPMPSWSIPVDSYNTAQRVRAISTDSASTINSNQSESGGRWQKKIKYQTRECIQNSSLSMDDIDNCVNQPISRQRSPNSIDSELLRGFSGGSVSFGSCSPETPGRWQKKELTCQKKEQAFTTSSYFNGKNTSSSSSAGRTLSHGFSRLGHVLQKVNLIKKIEQMEQSQNIADEMEAINNENLEEEERKNMVRQAEEACRQTIIDHLEEYLSNNNGEGTYEEWIQQLHPENIVKRKTGNSIVVGQKLKHHRKNSSRYIDHRFFAAGSDHLKIWNTHVSVLQQKDKNVSIQKVSPCFASVFSQNGDASLKYVFSDEKNS